jgi:hypothetical protein
MSAQTTPGTRCSGDEAIALLRLAGTQGDDGETALTTLCEALKTGIYRRRLAVLEEGDFGMVPEDASPGDSVVVLIGRSCCQAFSEGIQTLL